MAQFSKDKWPTSGPVRDFLSFLDEMHRAAGQPSLSEMGNGIHLAPSTISAFFTGARLINRGNLELLVECLGGDPEMAERLRRTAAVAWNESRSGRTTTIVDYPPWSVFSAESDESDATARLEVVIFRAGTNLLNRPEVLVGRDDLIERIGPWLDAGKHVLLHGLAGSGKTAVAATIADRRQQADGGSYLWLRAGGADEDVVLDGLARSLASRSAATTTGDARLLAVREAIAATGVRLCVIDDAWDAVATRTILRAMPERVGVLVTSRLKLSLDHDLEVAGLAPSEASRLLAIHGHDDAFAWQPGAEALCADLGYHPYAIEIAGCHLRQYGLSPAELRDHIGGAPHELAMPAGFAAADRASVRRLLDRTSAALPSELARSALAAFGAFFSGTLTVELLGTYLRINAIQAREALHALVDLSLAKRVPGSPVYEVHDLTMSYARAANTDLAATRKEAIAALRDLATSQVHNLDLLGAEMDNLLAGAVLAVDTAPDDFLSIVESIVVGGYLDENGHTVALLRLLDEAIDSMREAGQPLRLHALVSKRGNASYNAGDLPAAAACYTEALDLAPSPQRRVVLLGVLGKVLAELDRHDEAEALFREAYAVAESEEDETGTLRVLEQHSVAAFQRQDFTTMRELTLRGVELSRRLGDRTRETVFLVNLGNAEYELGVRAALRHHEQAREIAEELNSNHLRAMSGRVLALDWHALEKHDEAAHHYREALALYRKLGQTENEREIERIIRQFGYLT